MRIALVCLVLLFPSVAFADIWAALSEPRAVALMRHALAPGTGDPATFRLEDCATQRNLSDTGRAQARAAGQSIRARGIAFDAVLSSRWCRALESAALLDLGPVTPSPPLDSFFSDRGEGPAQTAAAWQLIEGTTGRLMIVTHQVNITALTGAVPRSGEMVVLVPRAGGWEVAARGLP